jgi:ribosomal protein S15P/S13E
MGYQTMTNDNMNVWDMLSKTNPDHTKKVPSSYGKQITTIDAMQQIKNMTEAFGPVGKGWSYQVKYNHTDKIVFAEVSIQYFMDNKWYGYGPVCSLAPLGKKNGGLDDEAPKKAMTDALTKAFSHLGLNADVFLGKFDNNKYVQELKKEFAQKSSVVQFPQKQNSAEQSAEPTYLDDEVDVEEIISRIKLTKTDKQFQTVKSQVRSVVNYLKTNNFKAYEQIRDISREHEVNLTNNQRELI